MPIVHSRAYVLADQQSAALLNRYQDIVSRLARAQCTARLDAFHAMLKRGNLAINASLSTCLKVLQTGRFLTAYEMAAQASGTLSGPVFDTALQTALGAFFKPRVEVERLLCFDGQARYGYWHVGGDGPDYGGKECCVLLERSQAYRRATCFAGDTITALFNANGDLCVSASQALERLAIRDHMSHIATIYNADLVRSSVPQLPLDEAVVKDVLSNRATLIELQVHEPVDADNIKSIRIGSTLHRSIGQLLRRFQRASSQEQGTRQYDVVRTYMALHALAKARRIPILGGQ